MHTISEVSTFHGYPSPVSIAGFTKEPCTESHSVEALYCYGETLKKEAGLSRFACYYYYYCCYYYYYYS